MSAFQFDFQFSFLFVDQVDFPLSMLFEGLKYGAQNEAYMSWSAEKWVRCLCFNELGVGG